jgi:hypothetical protein
MTTAEQMRSTIASASSEVRLAGVPWPIYKLVALTIALAVLLIVGIATASAAPAVLAAAAAGTVVWLGLGVFHSPRH